MRKVFFSPKAGIRLDEICIYLETNWPPKVRRDFLRKFSEVVLLIAKYPEAFPASDVRPQIHRCIFTKHNILYYRVKRNEIELITIFDARQNPEKLKRVLKKK